MEKVTHENNTTNSKITKNRRKSKKESSTIEETSVNLNSVHFIENEPGKIELKNRNEIVEEYLSLCKLYQVEIDSSVIITLKTNTHHFKPSRIFSEKDFLVFGEILMSKNHEQIKHITSLNFHHSKLGSNGAIWLSKILKVIMYTMQLINLNKVNPFITSINLSNNGIGPRGARSLAKTLETNRTITELNLHGNSLYKSGAIAISDSICKNSNLRSLDLSNNNIGFYGVTKLNLSLKNHKSIKFVDLTANNNYEETLNSLTHGMALLFSLIGAIYMISVASSKSAYHVMSCTLFSLSLIVMYTSSTLFHGFFKYRKTQTILRILDHAAIYILIAGTYTPFLMVNMHHYYGFPFLIAVWTFCVVGVSTEAFFMDKFPILSTSMYVMMGWMVVFIYRPFVETVSVGAIKLIALGGFFYTSGVYFYIKGNHHPIQHTIWHIFVFFGSLFHYFAILFYVVPLSIPKEIK